MPVGCCVFQPRWISTFWCQSVAAFPNRSGESPSRRRLMLRFPVLVGYRRIPTQRQPFVRDCGSNQQPHRNCFDGRLQRVFQSMPRSSTAASGEKLLDVSCRRAMSGKRIWTPIPTRKISAGDGTSVAGRDDHKPVQIGQERLQMGKVRNVLAKNCRIQPGSANTL